jgi:hypothetical protein
MIATPTREQINSAYSRYGIHLDRLRPSGECDVPCPFHDDRKASMSINAISGLWNCHADAGCGGGSVFDFVMRKDGCDFAAAKAIVCPKASKVGRKVAVYNYCDEDVTLAYQNVRYEPKQFRLRRPDPVNRKRWIWDLQGVKRVPYGLPELRQHALDNRPDNPVFITEGEKDADRVRSVGLTATTSIGGHGQRAQWKQPGFTDPFKGLHVVISRDNDAAGLEFANCVAAALVGVAASIKLMTLTGAKVKDAHDWFTAGGTKEGFLELSNQAELWRPCTEPNVAPRTVELPKIQRTEMGNATRFLNRHGKDVLHCAKIGWLVWDGKRWKSDSDKDVIEKMKDTVLAIAEETPRAARR